MIAQWFSGRLLALYPAEFLREYGAEMREQFRGDWKEAPRHGFLRAAAFWPHAIADWALAVFQLHGEITAQDLRSAGANLAKRPFSTTALVILLSLAIAGTTSLCAAAAGLVFRRLPFETTGRLVFLAQARAAGGIDWLMLPRDIAEKFRQTSLSLDAIAFQTDFTETLDGFYAHGWFVTPAVLTSLGIAPALGRLLQADDDNAAVIGPRLWQSRYQSRPSAIGSAIRLFGREYRIVGVLQESPAFPFDADILASRSARNGSAAHGPPKRRGCETQGTNLCLISSSGAVLPHSCWCCCWPAPTSRAFNPDTFCGANAKWQSAWPWARRATGLYGF